MKFEKLEEYLNKFQLTEQIVDERELEKKLTVYLKDHGFSVKNQVQIGDFRNDIVVTFKNGRKICIELKVVADVSVAKQLDNYLQYYPHGLILMCWKASETTRTVINNVNEQTKTPIRLIEVRNNNPML